MSTYSSNLRIELITNGTQAGTWGDTTNNNLAYVLDSSIAGYQTVSVTSASQALTYTSGPTATASANQSIYAMLRFTTTTGAAFAVYAPPASKAYIVWNNSGYSMTIYNSSVIGNTTAAGTGVTVTNNSKIMVWSDATNFYELQAANLTGTLAIANGGTGQVTANAALNALLPSQGSNANKYLQTDGTNTSWDAVSLSTADITGTLAVTNGGTGATTASGARTNLGLVIGTDVPSITGSGASGTWGISISGNAATATNVAYSGLTGTVPTWNQNTTGNAATATTATTATALSTASGSAPSYGARAWVNFDGTGTIGTNQTIRGSGNVTSVYKNGTGDYTITFTTAMSDANYAAVTGGCIDNYGSGGFSPRQGPDVSNISSSACRVICGFDNGVYTDWQYVAITIFR